MRELRSLVDDMMRTPIHQSFVDYQEVLLL